MKNNQKKRELNGRDILMTKDELLDRLRVTRELTKGEYKKLKKYEENHDELKAEQIAEMFDLKKSVSVPVSEDNH